MPWKIAILVKVLKDIAKEKKSPYPGFYTITNNFRDLRSKLLVNDRKLLGWRVLNVVPELWTVSCIGAIPM